MGGDRRDPLECLGSDISTSVLVLLDDPADLVRASSVSWSWRRFVISNGLCKNICLRMFPELSVFHQSVEGTGSVEEPHVGCSMSAESGSLESEYRIYSHLCWELVSHRSKRVCPVEAISASSTDNYPDESIENTLEPGERVDMRPSYWSSKGSKDPQKPETLSYRLISKLCLVDEIKIQPFRAFFQYGHPIYSAQAVRFRMGHSRILDEEKATECIDGVKNPCEEYIWTYISPVFPMLQENFLQSFKLPRPVVCIGGIVHIELLGRVQRQEMDNLYYICVCHVQIIGQPLSSVFNAHISPNAENLVLRYFPPSNHYISPSPDGVTPGDGTRGVVVSPTGGWLAFAERLRHLGSGRRWRSHAILSTLMGNVPVSDAPVEDQNNGASGG